MLQKGSRMASRIESGSSASTSGSSSLRRLPNAEGFAFDLAPSREDPLARRAVEHVFGKDVVDGCFSRLHRSSLNYSALMSDLYEYDRPHAKSTLRRDPVYSMALESVRRDLCSSLPAKLIPYTTGAVPSLTDFPRSKSPGLPYKLQGYRTKGEVCDVPENVADIRVMWHHIAAGKSVTLPDVCLFARAQVCDAEKEKVRGVWGYPLAVYMEEARFFYPIMDFLKSSECKFPIGYGLEINQGGMIAVSDLAMRHAGSQFLMTDWSKFDKGIAPWLIRDAFSLLAELIDFGHVRDVEGKIWPVRSYRSQIRWKKMINYFVETPVRTCKGERFLVCGGVPSGSCFTNVIDTLINCLVTRFVSYHTTGAFPLGELYLGDDGICVFPPDAVVDLTLMSEVAVDSFSMTLSAEKSFVTKNVENIHFLGYYNRPVGMPNRDQSLLIVSFVHPERSRRTAEECAAAALGQMWANFDPRIAAKWWKVIRYVQDEYPMSDKDVVEQLKRTAHRHKYLFHIGRDLATITLPELSEFGVVLDVLPKPVPRKYLPSRVYNYAELALCGYLRFFEVVRPPDEVPE